jgi:SpoVK/Ycf46/Vps4 family AAA+-type ATPase
MPRADLLLSLIRAAAVGDQALVRKTVEAIVAEERAKRHEVLADQIERQLRQNGTGARLDLATAKPQPGPDVTQERTPARALSDLVLADAVDRAVRELIEEHHRADLLRSYGLSPRNRILLTGPPGNGKTSLAEAIAHGLMVPFIIVRYDAVITSYLGETATRLRRVFEYALTRRCVLFFDEFDTLGKERGDLHETGEIKRVVSSLLLQIDDLPSHVVVVSATNHPELLDRAVWRRFQVQLELRPPSRPLIERYLEAISRKAGIGFEEYTKTIATALTGSSFSEIEDFVGDVMRAYVLCLPEADLRGIVMAKLAGRKVRPGSTRKGSGKRSG